MIRRSLIATPIHTRPQLTAKAYRKLQKKLKKNQENRVNLNENEKFQKTLPYFNNFHRVLRLSQSSHWNDYNDALEFITFYVSAFKQSQLSNGLEMSLVSWFPYSLRDKLFISTIGIVNNETGLRKCIDQNNDKISKKNDYIIKSTTTFPK